MRRFTPDGRRQDPERHDCLLSGKALALITPRAGDIVAVGQYFTAIRAEDACIFFHSPFLPHELPLRRGDPQGPSQSLGFQGDQISGIMDMIRITCEIDAPSRLYSRFNKEVTFGDKPD